MRSPLRGTAPARPATRRQPFILGALCLSLLTALLPASAAVLRVRSGVTNASPDGQSWTNAFATPAPALAAARPGDEVWVAAGVYPGPFTLPAGVSLLGGFAGTETAREERNRFAHFSVLDGQLRTNVLTVAAGAAANTRVDGLVIRQGFATSGAGLRVSGGAPVIADCLFFDNNATVLGNAVYLEGGTTAVVTNNHFAGNGRQLTVPPTGGGAIALGSASPRIEGNTFVGNRARDGGAVYSVAAGGLVTGNWFIQNEAWLNGGGFGAFASATRVTHNRFYGNTAGRKGGGVSATDGSTALVFNNALLRNRAALTTNEPRGGGGIFVDATSVATVLNNTLVENLAPVGGILCSNRNALLANNLVSGGPSGIGGVTGLQLRRNNVSVPGGTNYVGFPDVTGTAGNLAQNPRFAGDPRAGEFALLADSPCRDAGETNAVHAGARDLDGQPRTLGLAVDIGADESDGLPPPRLVRVVHVSPDGDDGRDGSDWAAAVASVQQGIDLASRTGGEVWVRAGTYVENVTVRAFTRLYGGFAGTETSASQRDWRANPTVLDGAGEGTVVVMFGLEAGETLDGFTVRGGISTAGGGALISGDVQVRHNRFEQNQAGNPASASAPRGGAGLYSNGGDSVIANNTFVGNLAFSRAAAVPAEGAGLKVVAGRPALINNVFLGNFATNTAAGGQSAGGGLFVGSLANPVVANNSFLGNHATPNSPTNGPDLGGAIHWAQATNAPAVPGQVVNNLFAYNRSGVHFADGVPPTLRHNLAWGQDHGDYAGLPDPTGTAGNLRADPRLVSPFLDPHLADGSPARDAGDSGIVAADWQDADAAPRVAGDAVDIGADEFSGTAPGLPTPVRYVTTSGSDTNAGTSWETAKRTVQAAVDELALTGGEVWVGAGTYSGHVQAGPFIHLYGGFAGTETDRSQRRPRVNATLLDGSQDAGSPVVRLDTFGDRGVLDGFRIQGGTFPAGAGVAVTGSPRIERNLIVLNDTTGNGGGLYCAFGSPCIAHNIFAVNSADKPAGGLGGALFLDPPAGHRPEVLHNDFLDNTATNGGAAIYLGTNATFVITDNILAFNQSGIASAGAAATVDRNCLFQNGTNDLAGVTAGSGNLTADPRFVDWRSLHFHLRSDSPCIDAGQPTTAAGETDLGQAPRLFGSATDIGATEFQGNAASTLLLTLTSPANGSRHDSPGIIPLTVDFGGVTNLPALVEYLTSTGVVATATSSPFSASLTNFAPGQHALHALAVMPGGDLIPSLTNVFQVTTPAPTVVFPTLTDGRIFEAPFTLNLVAQWNKIDGQVVSLELLTNGVRLLQATNLPATQSSTNVPLADLAVGDYAVRGIVTDELGIRGTNEVAFSVRLAPLPALISRPELTTNGGLSLNFTLPTGAADYVLEHSTNFVDWRPLATNRGGTSTNWLLNPPLTNAAEFFRNRGLYP